MPVLKQVRASEESRLYGAMAQQCLYLDQPPKEDIHLSLI
jgi:hypothetical protein